MDEKPESIEELLIRARKGAGAEGGREYIGNFLWARMWKAVTSIANCTPDLPTLLHFKAEITVCMKLAQEIQLDLANAEAVVKRMRELFTHKPQI